MYFPFAILALTGSLAVAAVSYAHASPLDPEHFLDPRQEETFALIAEDLAALASYSGSQFDEPLSAAAGAPTEAAQELAAAAAAQEPAPVEPLVPVADQSLERADIQVFAAGELVVAPASAETTGSIGPEESSALHGMAPGVEAAALPGIGPPMSRETSTSADPSGGMSPNFMP
jgi:hypothetical protein